MERRHPVVGGGAGRIPGEYDQFGSGDLALQDLEHGGENGFIAGIAGAVVTGDDDGRQGSGPQRGGCLDDHRTLFRAQ